MAKQSDLVESVHEVADAIRAREQGKVSQRRIQLGSSPMALGNIATGALLFGQALSGFPFDYQIATVGLITLVCFMW